jgi:lipoprotein-releasing system ATP-binding protein
MLWVVAHNHSQSAHRRDGTAPDLLFTLALYCHGGDCYSVLRCLGLLSRAQGHTGASRRNYPRRFLTEIALQVVGLVRRVQGVISHTLVDGIDLSVEKGEFLAITGPSGSGKSSLLYLIGLLDAPTEGEIIICGQATSKLSEIERADVRLTKCGFVFQFHFLLPEFTALENVLLPMRAYGQMSTKQMNERAMNLLASLGLGGQAVKRPNQLSGGQRQRVALARALANCPEIIVADEPTGNLDTASTEQVFGILRDIANNGQTVVVVTHDAALAARADRRIHIVDGKIQETTFGSEGKSEIAALNGSAIVIAGK